MHVWHIVLQTCKLLMPVVQAIALSPVWNIQSTFRGSNLQMEWKVHAQLAKKYKIMPLCVHL